MSRRSPSFDQTQHTHRPTRRLPPPSLHLSMYLHCSLLEIVRCRLRFFNREPRCYLAKDISQERQEWMGAESGRGEEPCARWRGGSGLCHRLEQIELCDERKVDCRPGEGCGRVTDRFG